MSFAPILDPTTKVSHCDKKPAKEQEKEDMAFSVFNHQSFGDGEFEHFAFPIKDLMADSVAKSTNDAKFAKFWNEEMGFNESNSTDCV